MINKTLKYLFSVLSALYFVFAGTGYNIVDYCCDDCAREGIDFVAHHSCASVHHEKSHDCCDLYSEKHSKASDHQAHFQTCSHTNSCQIVRVQLDDFSVSEKIANTNNPSEDLFVGYAEVINTGHDINNYVVHAFYSPPDLPASSGREILANKSVLII